MWNLSSLTFRGVQQFKQPLPMSEMSLRKEPRPGAAVLNLLWLAQAHHQLGQTTKARSHLDKASAWLDSVGGELPRNADALNLHRHNWLEAHILRKHCMSSPK